MRWIPIMGPGILRSTDGGNRWNLISLTADNSWGFAGEGFAGFAWSTVNPQLVVAAVPQAYEGTLVKALETHWSYQGLYYSADSGATWNLATITDGGGKDIQGQKDSFVSPDGNAATSVVWNPVRKLFVAAVRYHGYYQSTDGMTWTRMAAQPGSGLTTALCPSRTGSTGSIDCPIFRGALAVNPQTGDTFAWTTDAFNQDQGLWQDPCQKSAGACTTQTITFSKQWNTAALEADTSDGPATFGASAAITDGDVGGDGYRFHADGFRLEYANRFRRADRQLHIGDHTSERFAGDIYVCVRNASRQCGMHLQSHH